MCAGSSRTARDTQNIPLVVPEQSIAPLKEILKRSLAASYHLADREVLQFLFSLPKKPILEGASLAPTCRAGRKNRLRVKMAWPSTRVIVFSRGSGWLVDRNRGGRCLADGRSRGGRCLANSSRRDRRANNMPGLYLLFARDVYAIAKVSEEANCEANAVQTEQHIVPEQRGDRCATYGSNDRKVSMLAILLQQSYTRRRLCRNVGLVAE